jgi:G3E family GTPase
MDQLDRQPESVKQAAVADRLVLTKTDLAAPHVADALKDRLRRLNPAAPLLEAVQGAVEPASILGAGLFKPEDKTPDVRAWLRAEAYAERSPQRRDHGQTAGHAPGHDDGHDHDHAGLDRNRHDDRIRAFAIEHDRPLDWDRFADWIGRLTAEHGEHLLRIKGILEIAGHDEPIAIHGVQHLFHPPASLPAWPEGARRSQLVFILRDLAESVIRQGFAEMVAGAPRAA